MQVDETKQQKSTDDRRKKMQISARSGRGPPESTSCATLRHEWVGYDHANLVAVRCVSGAPGCLGRCLLHTHTLLAAVIQNRGTHLPQTTPLPCLPGALPLLAVD